MKSLKVPKIAYLLQPYPSFQRVGFCYKQIVSNLSVHCAPHEADLVVLHGTFSALKHWIQEYRLTGSKRRKLIGYLAWEASSLPKCAIEVLSELYEVWVPSRYCEQIFTPYHPQVVVIPHVIERSRVFSERDLATIKSLTDHSSAKQYFLAIGRMGDRRKNLEFLAHVFALASDHMPAAELLVKMLPSEEKWAEDKERVKYLPYFLSNGEINALYSISTAFVSLHHSEGWGLCLSDALFLGCPVVATGFSGNMEYMRAENSYLIDFYIDTIKPQDRMGLFESGMRWSNPSYSSLKAKLMELSLDIQVGDVSRRVSQAKIDVSRFSRDYVTGLISARIEALL